MSFDSSIENRIKEYSKKREIKKILHIGACLGEEISFYEQLNPSLIYWFEPNPNLQTRLRENIGEKPFTNIIFPYAVSDKKGISSFNLIEDIHKTNPGCSSLQELKIHAELYTNIKKIGTCLVETINLDEFLSENRYETSFDLVSLDTQGHDFQILNSSKFILDSYLIVIETASVELYEGQKIDTEIEKFLNEKNFIKDYYHPFHSVWGDTLYVKNNSDV